MLLFKLFQRKKPLSLRVRHLDMLAFKAGDFLVIESGALSEEFVRQLADIKKRISQGETQEAILFITSQNARKPSRLRKWAQFILKPKG